MKIGTSHNELEDLLHPRHVPNWDGGIYTFWDRDLLILNEANEAFEQSIEDADEGVWEYLDDQWTAELGQIKHIRKRSWQVDYELLSRLMTADQMSAYLPILLQFVQSMPRRMLVMRRKVIYRFLHRRHSALLRQFPILTKQYVQSAPLLYPANDLFRRSERFVSVVRWNADQGRSAQKERLQKYIKAMIRMSDEELACRFTDQHIYERELERLLILSRDFRLTIADIYLEDIPQRIEVKLEQP